MLDSNTASVVINVCMYSVYPVYIGFRITMLDPRLFKGCSIPSIHSSWSILLVLLPSTLTSSKSVCFSTILRLMVNLPQAN